MVVLARKGGRTISAIVVDDPNRFEPPFSGSLFPCLIWDHGGCRTEADRRAFAEVLLDAGCRYAVCGGESSRAWEFAIDAEFVARHQDDSEQVLDAVHVMTTAHEGEGP
jgi:hypothetical protein